MEQTSLLSRITMNPNICHGKPTARNMRYPVTMILYLLSAGMSVEKLIEDYPALERADISACLAFGSKLTEVKSVTRLAIE
jgi:uncharacterized protein (DUF433 family)